MLNRLVLLVTGCGPSTPPSATSSPSAAPAGIPACDSEAVTERSDYGSPLRCDLHDARFPRVTFEYTDPGASSPAGRDQTVVVRVGDRVVQTITEHVVSSAPGPPFVPRWANDGDGQLVVVTNSGGTGGIGMAVWRARTPEGPFVRGGELFGFPYRMATTDEGFTALYAHASAASGGYTIFRFDGDRIVGLLALPVAVADFPTASLDGTGPTIVNRATRCRLVTPNAEQTQALRAAKVSADGAAERFCRQGWVGRTYAG